MKGVRLFTQGGFRFLVVGALAALLFPLAVQALGLFYERYGPFPLVSFLRDINTGDVNGDGLDDVLVARGDRSFSIMFSEDRGELANECIYGNGTRVYGVLAHDVDQNGLVDVIVAQRSSGDVSLWLNQGEYDEAGCPEFEVQVKETAQGPTELALGDLNGDGEIDLLLGADSHEVQILLNNGYDENGNWLGFGEIVHVTYLSFPRHVFTGDFDNDNRLDIAVHADAFSEGVYVFWNDGIDCGQDQGCVWLGGFDQLSTELSGVTVDYLNDDELSDISMVQGSSIKTFLSNGDRTFSDNSRYYGIQFSDVSSADYDGDGVVDLATANGNANTISIILNTNNGVFSPDDMVVYPVRGEDAWVVRAGHLDSIPDLDVVVGNRVSDDISVLLQLNTKASVAALGPDE